MHYNWPKHFNPEKRMKLLILDNYDSFTYNLVHIIRSLGYAVDVFRNDAIQLGEIEKYDRFLFRRTGDSR